MRPRAPAMRINIPPIIEPAIVPPETGLVQENRTSTSGVGQLVPLTLLLLPVPLTVIGKSGVASENAVG